MRLLRVVTMESMENGPVTCEALQKQESAGAQEAPTDILEPAPYRERQAPLRLTAG